jgi:hypothetical protein
MVSFQSCAGYPVTTLISVKWRLSRHHWLAVLTFLLYVWQDGQQQQFIVGFLNCNNNYNNFMTSASR